MTEPEDVLPYQWGTSPSEWIVKQLNDVSGRITDGTHSPPGRVDSGGVPLLGSGESSLHGLEFDEASMVSKEDYEDMSDKDKPEIGDILLPVVGTLGNPYLVKEDKEFAVQRSLAIISTDDSLRREYLIQTLQSGRVERQMKARARQSVQAGLYLSELKKLQVPVPPRGEQERIASVLYVVDQMIDTTQQLINKKILVRENTIDSLVVGELYEGDSALKAIGPKETTLPKSWDVQKLGEICSVKGGKRLPEGHDFSEEKTDYPYIRVADFSDFGGVSEGELKYLTEETHEELSRYSIATDDSFVSIVGTIGKAGAVPDELDGAILTENAARLFDFQGVSNKYLSLYLNSYYGQCEIKRWTAGNVQSKLALSRIKKIEMPVPNMEQQEEIVEIVEGIDKETVTLQRRIRLLKMVKQGLMQDLLSGEVRTPDSLEPLDEVVNQ